MTNNNNLNSKPKLVSKAPPIKSGFNFTIARTPDWEFYKHSKEVKLWQAVLISFDMNPDCENYGVFHKFKDPQILKRLRLLIGNIDNRKYFSPSTSDEGKDANLFNVLLPEFAAWCLHMGWNEIPEQLAALAKNAPQIKPAAKPDASKNINEIPGKLPRTAIGKLAIGVAWQIECKTGKQATANQVIAKLQELVATEPTLIEKIPHGVKWQTTKKVEVNFHIQACGIALKKWQSSLA